MMKVGGGFPHWKMRKYSINSPVNYCEDMNCPHEDPAAEEDNGKSVHHVLEQ